MKNPVLASVSTNFIISKEFGAYLVAVNGRQVLVEPRYDKGRRLATQDVALAIQHISRFMLKIRKPLDVCDFLLDFFATGGWKIEEADVEALQPEL